MNIEQLEERKSNLEKKCLILTRQYEALENQSEEKECLKIILAKKIKELNSKLSLLKNNLLLFLGYYNGTVKQVEIEKKKLAEIKKYFETKSSELADKIKIELDKLAQSKVYNKEFIIGLKDSRKFLNNWEESLTKKENENIATEHSLDVYSGNLSIRDKKLKNGENLLKKRVSRVLLDERKTITKLKQAKVELGTQKTNTESTEKNLIQSEKIMKSNQIKTQKLRQKKEAVVKSKKSIERREQRSVDDRKKMASERASLNSAIYQFKKSKK